MCCDILINRKICYVSPVKLFNEGPSSSPMEVIKNIPRGRPNCDNMPMLKNLTHDAGGYQKWKHLNL